MQPVYKRFSLHIKKQLTCWQMNILSELSRCKDEFVWSSIYCEPSCFETLKEIEHELLMCKNAVLFHSEAMRI